MRLRIWTAAAVASILPVVALASEERRLERIQVELAFETFLVEGDNIRLERSASVTSSDLSAPRVHQSVRLGPDGTTKLIFVTRCSTEGLNLDIEPERELWMPTGKETLPAVHHRMSIFDSWNTTLLADTGAGAHLDLRIVARFSERKEPAVLEGGAFKMHLDSGPLIETGPPGAPDSLVFTQVSMTGRGIMFGLPGIGVVKLSPTRFEGSTRCGSVSGYALGFTLGDTECRLWSRAPILPEGEWLLFGTLEPWPPEKPQAPFYGVFLLPGEKP